MFDINIYNVILGNDSNNVMLIKYSIYVMVGSGIKDVVLGSDINYAMQIMISTLSM